MSQKFPNSKFRVIVADASTATNEDIKGVIESFGDINLTTLINNVGGCPTVTPLEELTPQEIDAWIDLNARFPLRITRALLPTFTKTSKPRLIMTIGSLGDVGVPYAVPYGSSKAFNMSMSSCLDVEMRIEGKNLEVIGIPVGAVTEVAHNKIAATFFTPRARTMAKAALARVGCGRSIVIGYVGHAMQKFLLDLLPRSVRESVIASAMKKYREKALRNK